MLFRRAFIKAVAAAGIGAVFSSIAKAAGELPQPSERVLLRVTGRIDVTNQEEAAAFDRTMLNALPQHRLKTYTDWTQGPQVFEGPLLADVLERVGAKGDVIRAIALNDYAAEIPATDLEMYPVLLAIRRNGEAMTVREKGPLWIIYPNPDGDNRHPDRNNYKSVWQLSRLHVQ
ncbi:twin-arginine translocation signal domain-containing protein [Ferruginivarius sediminum]|uniref:Oxidoreductase n=1 Tax=Ferruginivarius sediminum TaxID=2661937 RepID=A0A369T8L7_9PROT|nr:twin-arginine translocation signal domain-containing protein [Ferruginivarius sediminum]RDD60814.1 hypothetical protein DRB17_15895 [Ferruginivarius sediminum]